MKDETINRKLHKTQKFAIAIPIILLFSICTKFFVEKFRISKDLHWIFEYGSLGALIISLLCIVFSFVNSVLIVQDLKLESNKKIIWILLSASVFLYFTIMLTIGMTRDVG